MKNSAVFSFINWFDKFNINTVTEKIREKIITANSPPAIVGLNVLQMSAFSAQFFMIRCFSLAGTLIQSK